MAKQALEGLKVADFCWVLAGPLVGLYLAHHGATVVRIESMRRPDVTRPTPPYRDNKPGINRSGNWDSFNSNKFASLLAAVDYHRRTGKGQYLDISQLEAGIHFIAPVILDYTVNKRIETRDGNRCPYAASHGAYPCQGDDRWCAIGVFSDEEWNALCQVMGNPEWTKEANFATFLARKQNEDELNKRLGEWTRNFTAEEVMEELQAAGVPAGVVKNAANIQDDPQLAYRHYFWQLEHPEIGMHYYEAEAFTLSKTPTELRMPSPLLGQHTEYVCREMLGMSDEEFVDLFNQGVFE